jgi:hypothetical protein
LRPSVQSSYLEYTKTGKNSLLSLAEEQGNITVDEKVLPFNGCQLDDILGIIFEIETKLEGGNIIVETAPVEP